MNRFISEKISSLAKFDDKILDILVSFENGNTEEICQKIENFRDFNDRILKISNNKYLKNNFLNLKEAFKFYGKDEMKAFFLFCVFCEILSPNLKSYKISKNDFFEISIMRNLIMFIWMKNYTNLPSNLLSTIILMEFGRIFIDEYIIKQKKELEFYVNIKTCIYPQDFTDIEQQFGSDDRESVASKMFSHFGLDEIAHLAKFSSMIDDADFDIKIPCAMIKVVKTVVNIYHRVDETSIDHTLNLLVEFGFEQEAFLDAVKKIAR